VVSVCPERETTPLDRVKFPAVRVTFPLLIPSPSLRNMPTKPGERKLQILQNPRGHGLEDPKAEKITTAGLAKRLDVSEAAFVPAFRQQGADVSRASSSS